MKLYSKLYFVTYVTQKGEINSSKFKITQRKNESDRDFLNLPEGRIASRLFKTIDNYTNADCRAILNFWFVKGEFIEI